MPHWIRSLKRQLHSRKVRLRVRHYLCVLHPGVLCFAIWRGITLVIALVRQLVRDGGIYMGILPTLVYQSRVQGALQLSAVCSRRAVGANVLQLVRRRGYRQTSDDYNSRARDSCEGRSKYQHQPQRHQVSLRAAGRPPTHQSPFDPGHATVATRLQQPGVFC